MKAVLLDALGTLVALEPPAPRLERLLRSEGFELSEERAARGFAAEIDYYLAHHLEGSGPEAVDDLRDRCAEVLRQALGLPGLDHAAARRALLGALRFEAYPDALSTLPVLRRHGFTLLVVSNWDSSLPGWIAHTGLLEAVDGVVTSAAAGAAKPDPAIFARALELAGVTPDRAVHVGDSPANDVEGARAAGIRPLLVQREGEAPPGVETIRDLSELPALL